jgi:bifunctional non-homologous end joining protein LigD
MALEEYAKKRSFGKTAEPRAESGSGREGEQLRFVVQKHAASRLHYDFRLELDGVLKSWAVPKGPSLDPSEKRLAMMVEDHPLDYQHFEGTITRGNYGAGTVMVWDAGTYTWDPDPGYPGETIKLMRQGIEKGELKFVLHGQKLHGSWALVKIHSEEPNAWLLLKHKDSAAQTTDVTAMDKSVLTGRDMAQIRESGDASQDLRSLSLVEAPKLPQPKALEPMLASLAPEVFDNPEWLYEIKWDGFRIMSHVDGTSVRLLTRNDQDYSEKYRSVADELLKVPVDCILDGEMVVVDDAGRSDFGALQEYGSTGEGNLIYYVFDLPFAGGRDLTGLPLVRRKELLRKLVAGLTSTRFSDHVAGAGISLFTMARENQLEGIMAKRANSSYLPGRRSPNWLKMKTHLRQEAVIGGFTQPRGSRRDLGALVLGLYDDQGKLQYIGHTGGGFSEQSLRQVHERLAPLVQNESPFGGKFKTNAPVTWVRPELLAEVSFAGWTKDGLMRQPIFIGLRDDKKAADVKKEVPVDNEKRPELSDEIKISHADKVYWPQDKFTKGDLVNYYDRVAEVILPYLVGRPESLHRNPGGISGPDFFQKDAPEVPSWVTTVPIYSESNDKEVHWVVCNDKEILLYIVNLGCIELNPWHSRVGSLDRPDYCLLDLDAKSVGFEVVVQVAKMVHQILEEYQVAGFPKTSGKTGMHICIPLEAKYTYEQSKQFAQIIMNLVHERLPEITSVERSPEKREGLIYLDYLQNRHGQTMAAPYCLRPINGAPVSTPLEWHEVVPGLDARSFNMLTMDARLSKVGDLWRPVLGPGVDLEAILATMTS